MQRTLLLLAFLAACRAATPTVVVDEAAPLARLPDDAQPLAAALRLAVDPSQTHFRGEATMSLRLRTETRRLWLHARGLAVSSATFVSGQQRIPARFEIVDTNEGVARVLPERPVPAGDATLELAWTAPFDPQVTGLYRVEEGGRWYAFTQFEPLFARRAFPSFDEPRFKIPWDVTVEVPEGLVAAGNMPIAETTIRDGMQEIRFQRTPPLPTYLLALAVGPFDVVEGKPAPPNRVRTTPLPIRGLAVHGKGPQLEYALERAGGIVSVLEERVGHAHPYPKLDLVAVPDFAAGAMENVGLITFREWLLLLDDTPPADQKRAFTNVLAHELAHQWFGNLVTMPWWDDLWLNEAFATWLAARAVEVLDPSQHADVELVADVAEAMEADGLVSARRIREPILSSHDVHNAFDDITYSKGAGVLAMFERWIGPTEFRAALGKYLQKHANGTATTDDLLAELETRKPGTSAAFRTFLDQPGVPLVRATVRCDGAKPQLTLTQSRWLPAGSAGSDASLWRIPIALKVSAGGEVKEQSVLLDQREQVVDLARCPDWLLPNADGAGYLQFSLDGASLEKLSKALPSLAPTERVAVARSLTAGITAGSIRYDDALEALPPFARTTDRKVLTVPLGIAKTARETLLDADRIPAFETWATRLVATHGDALRGTPKDDDDALVRKDVAWFLLETARSTPFRTEAAKIGRAWLGLGGTSGIHPEVIDPTLTDVVVAAAAIDGGTEVFDHIVGLLPTQTDPAIRRRLLAALGRVREPLATRARTLTLGEAVRPSDMGSILFTQLAVPENREGLWSFVQANYDAIVAKLPEEFVGAVPWMASGFCDEARAAEVETFFAPRIASLPGGPRNLAGTVEAIRLCAAQKRLHAPAANAFFAAQAR